MYQNEYNRVIEYIKTATDCVKDYKNIQRCEQNIYYFERTAALQCLQDMIREYSAQINSFGCLFDQVTVNYHVQMDTMSNESIKNQLAYIARHIPVYVLIKKGEEEAAKKICGWLTGNNKEG